MPPISTQKLSYSPERLERLTPTPKPSISLPVSFSACNAFSMAHHYILKPSLELSRWIQPPYPELIQNWSLLILCDQQIYKRGSEPSDSRYSAIFTSVLLPCQHSALFIVDALLYVYKRTLTWEHAWELTDQASGLFLFLCLGFRLCSMSGWDLMVSNASVLILYASTTGEIAWPFWDTIDIANL